MICIDNNNFFFINSINHHSLDDLIYLSPDSDNIMEKYENNKIYIIGGIIDRTISKVFLICACIFI